MSTRIRYEVLSGGDLKSLKTYEIDGVESHLVLHPSSGSYSVVAVSGDVLLTGGSSRSLTTLKSQAKAGLVSLGVAFSSENRTARTTLVERTVSSVG